LGITVRELMEHQHEGEFHLAAGEKGLDRIVDFVNLMDYEYDATPPDAKSPDGMFDRNSIVVTSLLFAKNKPALILPVVKQLYFDSISALVVLPVYFESLSDEVIAYANEHSLPVFFTGKNKFPENVVVNLTNAVNDYDEIEEMEEDVKDIFSEGKTNIELVREKERKLFPNFVGDKVFYYSKKRKPESITSYHRILKSIFHGEKSKMNRSILPYDGGFFIVTDDTSDYRAGAFSSYGFSENEYRFGRGSICHSSTNISDALKSSYYACRYAEFKNKDFADIAEMGFFSVSIPLCGDYYMRTYCENLKEKLIESDKANGTDLWPTLVSFVRLDGNFKRVAEELSMHFNTVRYRIGKIREIFGMTDREMEFMTAAYMIVTYDRIVKFTNDTLK